MESASKLPDEGAAEARGDSGSASESRLLPVGAAVTLLWLLLAIFLIWSKFSTFIEMKPNEIGDFVAGTFAPLAFGWLAIAVILQRRELMAQRAELRLNRQELELNRKTLELQVVEQRRSAEQLQRQSDLLLRQEVDRAQQDAVVRMRDAGDRFKSDLRRISQRAVVSVCHGDEQKSDRKLHHIFCDPKDIDGIQDRPFVDLIHALIERQQYFLAPFVHSDCGYFFEVEKVKQEEMLAAYTRVLAHCNAMKGLLQDMGEKHAQRFPVDEVQALEELLGRILRVLPNGGGSE